MRIDLKGIKGKNNKLFYFNLDEDIQERLKDILEEYNKAHDYDNKIPYSHNIIKTTLSDIDLEQDGETSYIESLAAISCGKIKTKNQKTALNLLKMLESGLLDKSHILNDKYVIELWSALTTGNRNIVSVGSGYRLLGVKVGKGGVLATGKNIAYIAPKAKDVPDMMHGLFQFINEECIINNIFYNAILKSIVFSAYFVYVHPFSDGNGRLSRLLTNKILIDNGLEKFKYISINTEIIKNKKMYQTQLQNIEKIEDNNLTMYIKYMLNLYANLLHNINNPNRRSLDYKSLTDRQKIMLNCIRGSAQGIYVKQYKNFWNNIAQAEGYKKIKVEDAEKDLTELLMKDFIVYDSRYVLYPGFKYYNK